MKPAAVEINYKDGTSRTFTVLKKPVKDSVKVLRDAKGKGVYDEAKEILTEEMPSGLLFHEGWLYVAGQGTVRRCKQTATAGPFGKMEVIAQGFGGLGQHQVSGLTLGNDGWLYISAGTGDHFVEGSDGSRVDVPRTGAVFRCKPDGGKIHLFALGFSNPYGNGAFDSVGNLFHADNGSGDGKFKGCRLLHVAEEADFGWRALPGPHGGKADPLRAAMHGELPGKMEPLLDTGHGVASGVFIYNDTFFPEEYRGLFYRPDAAGKGRSGISGAAAGRDFCRQP